MCHEIHKSYSHLLAHCQHMNEFSYCENECHSSGDMVGLGLEGLDGIFNVSGIVYQHLECPDDMYGPGCEDKCECSVRETCQYIIGCFTGISYL